MMALLEWRNTSFKGIDASPVQLLYRRRTRTRLPVARKVLLVRHVIPDLPKKIDIRKQKQKQKQKQKLYYDHANCHNWEMPLACVCGGRIN